MQDVLKMITGVEADPCVSIILNTHRTHPDHERDPIVLKNMLTEAGTSPGQQLRPKHSENHNGEPGIHGCHH
jgi:hypothetical protein